VSCFIRSQVEGGTFFFTLVTYKRVPILGNQTARRLLGEIICSCQKRWPMEIDAFVFLLDHLHTIWTLPSGDTAYSKRWGWIKKEFTKKWLQMGHPECSVSERSRRERRCGIWQPRFWEHTIRDERDLESHLHYIHYNPVKHGLVRCPHEWPWSSLHRWVEEGVYEEHWACNCRGEAKPLVFRDIERFVGE
jgi:putative transposase